VDLRRGSVVGEEQTGADPHLEDATGRVPHQPLPDAGHAPEALGGCHDEVVDTGEDGMSRDHRVLLT